jgi:hypothetical protein
VVQREQTHKVGLIHKKRKINMKKVQIIKKRKMNKIMEAILPQHIFRVEAKHEIRAQG